ncbi:hypothetical protein [Fundidesulfovibrio agrisoli]|uniref:hypothetical protein n=1 Tax=Fundidesulfovibrio agrisoli TaxID=2922717 RepID=UPI001FAE32A8|nr:hypothetical protein [Fundidesulfovibrio agrisoli]
MRRAAPILLLVMSVALAWGCAPKGAPIAAMPEAPAPQWKPGDYWEFTGHNRSAYAISDRMEVASAGDEIVLRGRGDTGRQTTLAKDLSVTSTKGGMISYGVVSGKDAYLIFPMKVGASQTFRHSATTPKGTQNYTMTVTVEAAEEVAVPAGTFKTFRLRVAKKNDTGWTGDYVMWYSPEVRYFVRIYDTQGNQVSLVRYGR